MDNIDCLEEYDKQKTKVLKYIIYKKRTEREVRQKFENTIEQEILEDIIEELKENSYIQRAIAEYIALKNLSMKEIKYKLFAKGLNNDIIDEYFSNNKDDLIDYEIQSIKNIFYKKLY